MKRILFVHHVSSIGGGSYCLLNLLKVVDRGMYQPIVLLQGNGPLVTEIEKLGIDVYFYHGMAAFPYNKSIFQISTLWCYLRIWLSMSKFRKALLMINPDILYLNNSMLNPYLKVGKDLGFKTIIHIREHWPMEEHKIQLGWFQNNICNYADRIVAINQYSAYMVSRVAHKITIVYDWIDFSNRYKEHDLNKLMGEDVTNKKIFLFTGGFQQIKGALEVIETFSKCCDDDSRLLILGVNKQDIFIGLKGAVKKILLAFGYKVFSVKLQERINRDKRIVCLPPIYEIKDIVEKSYCVLSYFTIPHANLALAESIILKTPIIAARTEESEEYSFDGKYAILFPLNDRKRFENAIINVDSQRAVLKDRFEDAALVLANKFDQKQNVNIFHQVLDELNINCI